MVAMTKSSSRERLGNLINSVKSASDIPSKLQTLRQLNQILQQQENANSLSEFLPRIFEFQSDQHSPVRKFATEIIGEIGLKHLEFVPEIVPVLMLVLEDLVPAVARQAISCGISLFRATLEKITIQGLYASELDDLLKSSWSSMLEFKEKIYSIAFQCGVRLLALKFVEEVILLYTPDPNGTLEPPSHEGSSVEFNISWLRGGHPVLNVGDLSIEASRRLSLLLDQLRMPTVKSISNLMIIVLVNSLATIAKKRPPYYGRILPVLLGLDPSNYVIEGMHGYGAHHALKNSFLTCLKCNHQGAAPWRDRLVGVLSEMKAGKLAEEALHQVLRSNGSVEEAKEDLLVAQEEKISIKSSDGIPNNSARKRSGPEDSIDVAKDDDVSGKRARSSPTVLEESSKELDHRATIKDDDNGPVQQLVAMFGALVAQGEKAVGSLEILISSISADLLAEVVMANMRYLPTGHPQPEGDNESLVNMTVIGSDSRAKYPSSFLANFFPAGSFPPIAAQMNADHSVSKDSLTTDEEELETTKEEEELQVAATDIADVYTGKGTMGASSLVSTDVEDASQELGTSLGTRSNQEVLPSISNDRSEELSPKVAPTDSNSLISSTATSVRLHQPLVLPKMSAPVVNLADEQKDQLQNLAFIRIVEAYKQIAVAGSSPVRFSLLASIGVEFPSELDPWELLKTHILSDYVVHEGHELTLHVLYRLFGEVEEEHDFFSSTTAASVYEMFLLAVAEALRDSFPPSDKSLGRLLGEAPYLPNSIFSLLESLCSPGNIDKTEELQSGDRVTQGLSTVWSLILQRPPIRESCLKIALQSAVHHLEEVRMKALRLVANKLYPLSSIAQQIEDFAKEKLLSVVNSDATESMDAEGSFSESQKDLILEKPSNEHQSMSAISKDLSSETHQSCTSESVSSLSISEAQRCLSLYFALCTKKHSLFRQIFIVYKSASKAVKQAVNQHIPILVRTMGSSSDLLEIISDPPTGSENLLMQVLQTLTEGAVPSPELLFTIRKLYDSKIKNAEILIPILPFLPRDEILVIFPHLVNLPLDKFQIALARTLQGSSHSGTMLTPAEVLIAIHGIDPDRDGIPLKKVTDACNACFEQRQIFTQQVLAKVEQIPLPLLFMRTVLQAIGAFPALVEFIMEILSRLVSKQIWKYPKLWVGFLKCALLTKPQSFNVLLQLPPPQLESALNRTAALKAPLVVHASQPNIKSSLPRSVLVVLGIAPDPQTSSQAQTSQAQTGDTNNSGKDLTVENSKTGETSNSDKEVLTEKSKETSVGS
uniref:Symplekin C-terminal domain-containing protein n=1 Tax=Salix viminalis TaxID=40686 RepID=A0A6N2K7K1_SALVM